MLVTPEPKEEILLHIGCRLQAMNNVLTIQHAEPTQVKKVKQHVYYINKVIHR